MILKPRATQLLALLIGAATLNPQRLGQPEDREMLRALTVKSQRGVREAF
jgi:hypothetical protein